MDLDKPADMDRQLLCLSERTATRLRKQRLAAGTVQVKIRQSDFTTCTRQRKIEPPSDSTDHLYAVARELLHTWLADNPAAKIRLLGVGGSDLESARQQDLFDTLDARPASAVDRTVDEVRERFGGASLGRARTLERQ